MIQHLKKYYDNNLICQKMIYLIKGKRFLIKFYILLIQIKLFLDENIEIQNQIFGLELDIKKYFVCSRWNV